MQSGLSILSQYKLYYSLVSRKRDPKLNGDGGKIFKKFKVKMKKG